MHPIRKEILLKLIFTVSLPFSKLKPKELEANLFMYHLKQLITEVLIEKNTKGEYQLTQEGKAYVDKLSLQTLQLRIQPKVVTLIVCQNKEGQYLVYSRKRQPYIGKSGFPYGKIHLGETLDQAAQRELQEKSGITATLHHAGEVYITTYEQEKLLSYMLCHVFVGINPKGDLLSESKVGVSTWKDLNQMNDQDFIPGFIDILQLTKITQTPNRFFKEFTFYL